MALTNFPSGITSFGVPVLGAGGGVDLGSIPVGPQYWFVSSTTGDDGFDGSWDQPFATLQAAADMCTAAYGDVIVIKPGHAETLISAAVLTLSKAGVRVVGLGQDANRPTFTFSTAVTASMLISGANVSVKNIVGVAGIDSLTKPIDVTGDGVELDIEWRDGTYEAANVIRGVGTDRLKIRLRDQGLTGGSLRLTSISLNAATETEIIIDQYGKCSTSIVNFVTAPCLGVRIYGFIYNSGTTDGSKTVVDTVTGSTWYANVYDGTAGAQFDGGSGSTFGVQATDLTAVTNALYGTSGITTWNTGAAAGNGVSISEALRYVQDQVINGTGTALAANTSLYGVLAGATGVPVWPSALAYANNVSIAEVLGYVQDAVRNGSGTGMGTNKGIADALGTDGVAITDSAVSVLGVIGSNTATTAFASTSVIPNHDGNVLERLEALAQATAANSPVFNSPNYFVVTAPMNSATWNTVATHQIAAVTGMVQMTIIPQCTATLTDAADGASIQLGITGTTNAIIASTAAAGTGATGIETNEFWVDATPADVIVTKTQLNAMTVVVGGGIDVGYEITGAALTGGVLLFHVYWTPLDATGAVAAGNGGPLA